jgi:NADP-dependent 3-hydroxy acid dehydrogenase YdfG
LPSCRSLREELIDKVNHLLRFIISRYPPPPPSPSITQNMSRVILITGASAGIGRSCAVALSKAFPNPDHPERLVLVLVGRRQEELEKTGQMCREGTVIEVGTGDVGKEEDVERIFAVVKEKYGRLDLLFNVRSGCG